MRARVGVGWSLALPACLITSLRLLRSAARSSVAAWCWLMVMMSHQAKAPDGSPVIASISPVNEHSHACDTKCVAVPKHFLSQSLPKRLTSLSRSGCAASCFHEIASSGLPSFTAAPVMKAYTLVSASIVSARTHAWVVGGP
eukprot:scaffold63779_cov64-Phaeocystis_antarctica.AAC.2